MDINFEEDVTLYNIEIKAFLYSIEGHDLNLVVIMESMLVNNKSWMQEFTLTTFQHCWELIANHRSYHYSQKIID